MGPVYEGILAGKEKWSVTRETPGGRVKKSLEVCGILLLASPYLIVTSLAGLIKPFGSQGLDVLMRIIKSIYHLIFVSASCVLI